MRSARARMVRSVSAPGQEYQGLRGNSSLLRWKGCMMATVVVWWWWVRYFVKFVSIWSKNSPGERASQGQIFCTRAKGGLSNYGNGGLSEVHLSDMILSILELDYLSFRGSND